LVTEHGLDGEFEIDSAGTGSWHVGEPADARSRAEGIRRGCLMNMTARQVRADDFEDFDLLVAMDLANVRDLERWRNSDPSKMALMRSFDPTATSVEVPDPYYGGADGFRDLGDMLEAACAGLLKRLS
jgi:protein-tyrosine phosphatase